MAGVVRPSNDGPARGMDPGARARSDTSPPRSAPLVNPVAGADESLVRSLPSCGPWWAGRAPVVGGSIALAASAPHHRPSAEPGVRFEGPPATGHGAAADTMTTGIAAIAPSAETGAGLHPGGGAGRRPSCTWPQRREPRRRGVGQHTPTASAPSSRASRGRGRLTRFHHGCRTSISTPSGISLRICLAPAERQAASSPAISASAGADRSFASSPGQAAASVPEEPECLRVPRTVASSSPGGMSGTGSLHRLRAAPGAQLRQDEDQRRRGAQERPGPVPAGWKGPGPGRRWPFERPARAVDDRHERPAGIPWAVPAPRMRNAPGPHAGRVGRVADRLGEVGGRGSPRRDGASPGRSSPGSSAIGASAGLPPDRHPRPQRHRLVCRAAAEPGEVSARVRDRDPCPLRRRIPSSGHEADPRWPAAVAGSSIGPCWQLPALPAATTRAKSSPIRRGSGTGRGRGSWEPSPRCRLARVVLALVLGDRRLGRASPGSTPSSAETPPRVPRRGSARRGQRQGATP
ncbi:MAG: hypothetical protein JWM47_161 [Acidimicrobiales bacterium]|nr:hypothetical protein [Acidimicrobiales bacterium]